MAPGPAGTRCALVLNDWIEVEQTVSELRIRLGERAKKSTVAAT